MTPRRLFQSESCDSCYRRGLREREKLERWDDQREQNTQAGGDAYEWTLCKLRHPPVEPSVHEVCQPAKFPVVLQTFSRDTDRFARKGGSQRCLRPNSICAATSRMFAPNTVGRPGMPPMAEMSSARG